MGFISCHISPLVIYNLGDGYTYTHTQTCTPTICTEAILRNQVHAGLWPVHTWFNNFEEIPSVVYPEGMTKNCERSLVIYTLA